MRHSDIDATLVIIYLPSSVVVNTEMSLRKNIKPKFIKLQSTMRERERERERERLPVYIVIIPSFTSKSTIIA